jgi:hypothetical protein
MFIVPHAFKGYREQRKPGFSFMYQIKENGQFNGPLPFFEICHSFCDLICCVLIFLNLESLK